MSAAHLHSGHCHSLPVFRCGGVDRVHGLSKQQRRKTSAIAAPEKEAEVFSVPASNGKVPKGLNKYSSKVTQPKSQGASQAMLYATGISESDMDKPQVTSQSRCCIRHGASQLCLMASPVLRAYESPVCGV